MSAAIPINEPWVDVAAVCRHVGFGRAYVTKLVKAGDIPAKPFRNGKRTFLRFRLSAVDEALERTGQADRLRS